MAEIVAFKICVEGDGPVLRTERETSQSSRGALETWALGLEPAYFEGAFSRARVE